MIGRRKSLYCSRPNTQAGFSIIELLVMFLIAGIVLGNLTTTLMQSTKQYHDRTIIAQTEERASMLLDIMAFELRLAGSGLPMGQEDFAIDDPLLGDAPLPVLLSSGAESISIRADEVGAGTMLRSDFTPGPLSTTITVESITGFEVGDLVYINDMSVGGDAGFQGTITSVSGNSIQFDSAFISTPTATFKSGSLVHPVSTITFSQAGGAVLRDTGGTPSVLMPNSAFTIEYLDVNGNPLTPPLTALQVRDELSSLGLTVTITSETSLKNGTVYTATANHEIKLRNIHLNRPWL